MAHQPEKIGMLYVALPKSSGHTRFVKKLRALLILLLCVALPYSATATMLQGMQCHHDGLGGIAEVSLHEHGGHEMHEHHHHDAAQNDPDRSKVSADHGCDCAVKCSCQHHCASSCSAVFTSTVDDEQVFASAVGPGSTAYTSHVADVHTRAVFRPPIAALTSAA